MLDPWWCDLIGGIGGRGEGGRMKSRMDERGKGEGEGEREREREEEEEEGGRGRRKMKDAGLGKVISGPPALRREPSQANPSLACISHHCNDDDWLPIR